MFLPPLDHQTLPSRRIVTVDKDDPVTENPGRFRGFLDECEAHLALEQHWLCD